MPRAVDIVIKQFQTTGGCNTYLLVQGSLAAMVDSPDSSGNIGDLFFDLGASLKYILLTHGHVSHIRSAFELKKRVGGLICIHKFDVDQMRSVADGVRADILLEDDQVLVLEKPIIRAYHTPGHTMGSVCFYVREAGALFTGDTLLRGAFGRVAGLHGMGLMVRSLKRLNSIMPPETKVYPGHGPPTTMAKEAWLDGLDQLS